MKIYRILVRASKAPLKGYPESGGIKDLLLESGILSFGIRNPAQEIHNPPNDWNLEFQFYWKGIQNHYLESTIQVTAIGRLHDDVILPFRPESVRVLLSCANLGFIYRITKFKYERKTKGILVIVVKWRHHANGDLSHKIWVPESNKLNDIG